MEYLIIAVVVVIVALGAVAGFIVPGRHRSGRDEPAGDPPLAESARTATLPRPAGPTAAPTTTPTITPGPPADTVAPTAPTTAVEQPEPTAGRLIRLRSRLARSQSTLGKGLLAVLARDRLDDDTWQDVEDTLVQADVGVGAAGEIVERLRERTRVLGTRTPDELRGLLADELVAAIGADTDRSLRTFPHADAPAVVLVVGVNGTGKTTTCGKLARVLIADGSSVVLGAADTFRAAAADQLQTWGARVGARTVRGAEGADPASVAFDAVNAGADQHVDVVLIDTAGRLHTKTGLMDELGKVKRVVQKRTAVDETLLVLDATTGQNGLTQARVFTQVVECTGIVLTKLDGTAKGGIVIAVQRELGIPVKLVGLGEGPDDLAPFEPRQFVDALLGDW